MVVQRRVPQQAASKLGLSAGPCALHFAPTPSPAVGAGQCSSIGPRGWLDQAKSRINESPLRRPRKCPWRPCTLLVWDVYLLHALAEC